MTRAALRLTLTAAALALAACAGGGPTQTSAPPQAGNSAKSPAAAVPAGLRPIAVVPAPLHVPPIPEPKKDSCGAWELQSLIGKSRSQAPAPVYPSQRRMACTTCPVSQDYRPDRLTILFDPDTGIIKELKCG